MLPKPVRRALKKNWGLLIVLRFRSVFLPHIPSSPPKKLSSKKNWEDQNIFCQLISSIYLIIIIMTSKKQLFSTKPFEKFSGKADLTSTKILIDKKKKQKNLYFLPPTPTLVQLLIINLQLIFKSDNQLIIKTHWA